ncbi:MAG: sn-glycerol-3-phosphate ABC transporter permease UgpE [Oceanidesulfovibrio sp.]
MVERRPFLTILSHLVLLGGVVLVMFPVYIALVGASHPVDNLLGRIPAWFGGQMLQNFATVLGQGMEAAQTTPVGMMMLNSLVMALGITVGKITISLLAAFAVVYFRFPLRPLCFWLIFITLMLPVEVRILPTFRVVAELGMLNSYVGLTLPLIASATATFLFRQFFLTIPDELMEAARIDGAGPMRFFWDVVLPLSRTNIAAMFVILFIYGWNQYLWPLIVTTDQDMYTVVMGIQRMVTATDWVPDWNLIMATAILALLPPVIVVIAMQRLFIKGLVETEK